jgi:hypothetical protein
VDFNGSLNTVRRGFERAPVAIGIEVVVAFVSPLEMDRPVGIFDTGSDYTGPRDTRVIFDSDKFKPAR